MSKIICSHCFLEFPNKSEFAKHNIQVAYQKAKRKEAYQAKKEKAARPTTSSDCC